jgi:tol-pal system protein YbgF
MMMTHNQKTRTAVSLMAVLLLVAGFCGCVTQRHIREVRADVQRVESRLVEVDAGLARVDSLVRADSDANNRLRADLSASMSEIQRQMAALLEGYNDLLQQINALNQRGTRVLSDSPGSQPGSVRPSTSPGSASAACTNAYDSAFILVRRGEYDRAIEDFRSFLQRCPNHEYIENAHYWIGECYYSLEKYADAITQLEFMVGEFKGSPNLGRAIFKLARSHQELEHKDEAKRLFQRLVDEFPGTMEAEQAKEQLKVLR